MRRVLYRIERRCPAGASLGLLCGCPSGRLRRGVLPAILVCVAGRGAAAVSPYQRLTWISRGRRRRPVPDHAPASKPYCSQGHIHRHHPSTMLSGRMRKTFINHVFISRLTSIMQTCTNLPRFYTILLLRIQCFVLLTQLCASNARLAQILFHCLRSSFRHHLRGHARALSIVKVFKHLLVVVTGRQARAGDSHASLRMRANRAGPSHGRQCAFGIYRPYRATDTHSWTDTLDAQGSFEGLSDVRSPCC